jgi:hypothetical protein
VGRGGAIPVNWRTINIKVITNIIFKLEYSRCKQNSPTLLTYFRAFWGKRTSNILQETLQTSSLWTVIKIPFWLQLRFLLHSCTVYVAWEKYLCHNIHRAFQSDKIQMVIKLT